MDGCWAAGPSVSIVIHFQFLYSCCCCCYLVPRLDGAARSVGGNSGYHGLVDEDKLIVDVTPKIRAVGAEICAFRIVNKHHGETPFEVILSAIINVYKCQPSYRKLFQCKWKTWYYPIVQRLTI